jgi:gamma-glutamylcyclotransferase (GGCT)/AIG2-like uncharacterized protein YtfP
MTPREHSPLTSVFVYGTLLPGERNEHVARQGSAYQTEPATLDGALLCDLRPEGYPALFQEGQGRVHGSLYTYAPADWAAALPLLDDLEGLHLEPPLYRRAEVTVQTAGGPRPAWVYFYARDNRRQAPGCVPVPSGRWTEMPGRDQPGEAPVLEDGRRR